MYGYSHPLTPHTYMDDFGGVHYRRRKEDRWVTPHIPALLELMHCHIFVDVCSSDHFKYLFKGPDHTQFGLQILNTAVDEFEDYMNARFARPAFQDLTYGDFFRLCYLETVPSDDRRWVWRGE
jgi:hypothetical protein